MKTQFSLSLINSINYMEPLPSGQVLSSVRVSTYMAIYKDNLIKSDTTIKKILLYAIVACYNRCIDQILKYLLNCRNMSKMTHRNNTKRN